jgi:hypothetical protein
VPLELVLEVVKLGEVGLASVLVEVMALILNT